MKFLKFAIVMTVMVIGLVSCKKDDEVKSVAGTWEGKWGFGYETPSFYEKWDLEKGGDLSAYYPDGTLYAVGTWDEDGDEIEAHYTPLGESYSYIFIGTYDEDDDEITGEWGDAQEPTNGGTFEMKRK